MSDLRKYANLTKSQREITPFDGDGILLGCIDGNILTVGSDATGKGTAVFIQHGSLPANNCFGNETGKTLVEEWEDGNLYVGQEGYHRGATFAGL